MHLRHKICTFKHPPAIKAQRIYPCCTWTCKLPESLGYFCC